MSDKKKREETEAELNKIARRRDDKAASKGGEAAAKDTRKAVLGLMHLVRKKPKS